MTPLPRHPHLPDLDDTPRDVLATRERALAAGITMPGMPREERETLRALRRRVSEKDFQQAVIDGARRLGYRLIYHTRDARGSAAGFPDLTLCRHVDGLARLVFAELKSESGLLSVQQMEWLSGLRDAGAEVYLLRPSQLEWFLDVLRDGRRCADGFHDWRHDFSTFPESDTEAKDYVCTRCGAQRTALLPLEN